ncbi:hypothetical protein BP6252_08893 [Coleophoma cylindrospora]|uniref:Uncharacterized protein n=1 Tax=Coleophoma cylindrospora TaxID=1849047 RepID=A0A3D8R751_9HELO|nr:hypothetical protein BP6252_08893 [Coleophoma cylindrospora]
MWHSPQYVATHRATSAIHSCSSMLYVMAERWPPAQQYRNAFERVKESILEYVSLGTEVPRDLLPSSTFNLATQDALKDVFARPGMESLGQAFYSIIAPEAQEASQSLPIGTTDADQLVFDLDNLGSLTPSEDQLLYEANEAQQSCHLDLAEGVEYSWDILDAVMHPR